jgi:hypothetical protein
MGDSRLVGGFSRRVKDFTAAQKLDKRQGTLTFLFR